MKKANADGHLKARPFLKWAGGKTQLLKSLQQLFPQQLLQGTIRHYYEPFLGSGAVFFHIAQHFKIASAVLYDINEELVLAYRVIQHDELPLIERLEKYQKRYSKLDVEKRKEFYYKQRTLYNHNRGYANFIKVSDSSYERVAQLIFLNKTCYNGLYRVNSKGEFNSPAGAYENPLICDAENLQAVHQVLQIAEIKHADFRQVLKYVKARSFVYFDPPYRPISKTAHFKAYAANAFNDNEQKALAEVFSRLSAKNVHVMLSNSDPKNTNPSDSFFDDLYADYFIKRIPATRMINSNAGKRGKIQEIVVTSYAV
jgi:DNA adenine methylase